MGHLGPVSYTHREQRDRTVDVDVTFLGGHGSDLALAAPTGTVARTGER